MCRGRETARPEGLLGVQAGQGTGLHWLKRLRQKQGLGPRAQVPSARLRYCAHAVLGKGQVRRRKKKTRKSIFHRPGSPPASLGQVSLVHAHPQISGGHNPPGMHRARRATRRAAQAAGNSPVSAALRVASGPVLLPLAAGVGSPACNACPVPGAGTRLPALCPELAQQQPSTQHQP